MQFPFKSKTNELNNKTNIIFFIVSQQFYLLAISQLSRIPQKSLCIQNNQNEPLITSENKEEYLTSLKADLLSKTFGSNFLERPVHISILKYIRTFNAKGQVFSFENFYLPNLYREIEKSTVALFGGSLNKTETIVMDIH